MVDDDTRQQRAKSGVQTQAPYLDTQMSSNNPLLQSADAETRDQQDDADDKINVIVPPIFPIIPP